MGGGLASAEGRQLNAVGFDVYNQAVTGDVAKCLTAERSDADHTPVVCVADHPTPKIDEQGVAYTLNAAVAYSIENHPADSRVSIDESGKVQTLTSRMGTGGGNVPMVMEPFVKSARARSADDATTWKEGKVENTLNTFDQGEARANELVVQRTPVICLQGNGIDRSDTAGCNGKGWKEDIGYTLNTIDRPAIAYRQGGFADYVEGEIGTLRASGGDLGGGTENLIVVPRYIVRRLTPTECARLQGFADWWGCIEQKDALTEEEYRFWLEVRNTHAAINGKKVQDYTEKQMLTWYNKLYSDSNEYKMWGNGIALPPALYCLQGIREALDAAVFETTEEAEVTDLSDAPDEIKEEIIKNDKILKERDANQEKTEEEETMQTITNDMQNIEPETNENVIDFNVVEQLKRLVDERKALANLRPENTRFTDDVRAIEYAVSVLEAVGL